MTTTTFPDALQRCGGDETVLKMTAGMVAEDLPGEMEKLDDAITRGDGKSASEFAHAIRGMIATFERGSAMEGMRLVEDAANADDLDKAWSRLLDCRDSVHQLSGEIAAFAKQA